MHEIKRLLDLPKLVKSKSVLLLGPRQTGKSRLLAQQFENAYVVDLLESDTYRTLLKEPEQLRERAKTHDSQVIIIDEIQRIPDLLNEVHILIEKFQKKVILTGSSTRKLNKDRHINRLGGRLRTYYLHPFVSEELGSLFNLEKALLFGLLPSIWFSDSPSLDIKAYLADYIEKEIAIEARVRNLQAFSRFIEVAALCSGQLLQFQKLSNDTQISRTTLYEYFQILTQTLLAYEVLPFDESKKRKSVKTSKYYFFDVGVMNALTGRSSLAPGTPEYGLCFEHFIFHEIKTYLDYHKPLSDLRFWQSQSHIEVDFVVDDKVAIEVKAKKNIHSDDLKGLRTLKEEKIFKKLILVSLESESRETNDGIYILPLNVFLKQLWSGELI